MVYLIYFELDDNHYDTKFLIADSMEQAVKDFYSMYGDYRITEIYQRIFIA